MSVKNIVTLNEINEQTIVFSSPSEWQQEDIESLQSELLRRYPLFSVISHEQGLDRESFQLEYKSSYFWLNFEYYSQSIWLEAMDQSGQPMLAALFEDMRRCSV